MITGQVSMYIKKWSYKHMHMVMLYESQDAVMLYESQDTFYPSCCSDSSLIVSPADNAHIQHQLMGV